MSNEFKLVSHKRKVSKNNNCKKIEGSPNSLTTTTTFPCPESQIRRIKEAVEEIRLSDLFDSVRASLFEARTNLGHPEIKEIICLGLGRIGECMISRYQFALLLCVKDIFKSATVNIYDPIFSTNDRWILQQFQCNILEENLEGKYRANNKATIFYLPHCPKQLSNNLLWANWGLNLVNCIIVSNSFQSIVENTSKRLLQTTGEFMIKISPYVVELAVVNSFKFFEIFNDTAIHIFPLETIQLIPEDLWRSCAEPKYQDDDLEFVKK